MRDRLTAPLQPPDLPASQAGPWRRWYACADVFPSLGLLPPRLGVSAFWPTDDERRRKIMIPIQKDVEKGPRSVDERRFPRQARHTALS